MKNDLSLDTSRIENALERSAVPVPAPPASDAGEKPSEVAALEEFIGRAAGAGRMYKVLSLKMAGTQAQRDLHTLSLAERDTEKSLQTEHLLLTGDTAVVPAAHPNVLYLIKALREAYAAELQNAAEYRRQAGLLPDCALRRLYRRLEHRERFHASVLKRVIEKTIY